MVIVPALAVDFDVASKERIMKRKQTKKLTNRVPQFTCKACGDPISEEGSYCLECREELFDGVIPDVVTPSESGSGGLTYRQATKMQ